jgi:DNA-binding response OmpR family regulator
VATGGPKPVVLVVDDEPSIRLLCRVNLELGGYEIREAGTLREARERVAEGGVDLVLLDMHLGTERSNDFLAELIGAGLAVAVVSGSTELESLSRAGADAVLRKPFTIDELESTVAELTTRRRSRL